MAKIKLVVSAMDPIPPPLHTPPPLNPHLGSVDTFTNDLVLERYNRKRPKHGLPKKQEDRLAGIHSGTLTLLRIADPGDRFYKPNTYVLQYVATYKFNDLRRTPLEKGQITAQGLVLFLRLGRTEFVPLEVPNKFAITGGTDAYAKARGEVIELPTPTRPINDKELHIEL
jgi:hypothetical protein